MGPCDFIQGLCPSPVQHLSPIPPYSSGVAVGDHLILVDCYKWRLELLEDRSESLLPRTSEALSLILLFPLETRHCRGGSEVVSGFQSRHLGSERLQLAREPGSPWWG